MRHRFAAWIPAVAVATVATVFTVAAVAGEATAIASPAHVEAHHVVRYPMRGQPIADAVTGTESRRHAIGQDAGDPWASFPTGPATRPIVVLHHLAQVDGFAGADRQAVAQGIAHVSAPAPVPPRTVPLRTAHGVRQVPAVSPTAAFAAWRRSSGGTAPRPIDVKPIRFVAIDLGAMTLATDRGPLQVPAWIFTSSDGAQLRWPAVSPEVFWDLGRTRRSSTIVSATVDATGTRLTLSVNVAAIGSTGSCPLGQPDVRPSQQQSTFVAVAASRPVAHPASPMPPGAGCMHLLYAGSRDMVVVLSRPLGGRVLVGPDGGVVPTTQE